MKTAPAEFSVTFQGKRHTFKKKVTVQRYRISCGGVRCLANLRNLGTGSFHVSRFVTTKHKSTTSGGGSETSRLLYWKLVERAKKRGRWRITTRGKRFIEGTVRLREYALVCTGNYFLGWAGGWVDVSDCYGKRFDLSETLDVPL